jgi:hypothetical protein
MRLAFFSKELSLFVMDAPTRWPTGKDLREILLSRCEALCRGTGMAPSHLAKLLTGNSGFLYRVGNGGNFTLNTFDSCMLTLDQLWLAHSGSAEDRLSGAAARAATLKKPFPEKRACRARCKGEASDGRQKARPDQPVHKTRVTAAAGARIPHSRHGR